MAVTAMFLEPGSTLGGCRIREVIGVGGMATVYRAEQLSPQRDVALKVIAAPLGSDESFQRRFRDEAEVLGRLSHPNIITIYYSGEVDGTLFLVMQLVRGETLAERIADRPLTVPETVKLLAPVADALDAAHRAGVVHRDVKPHNILIDGTGRPYLADFGIAKAAACGSGTNETRGYVGTDQYAAPEQILGQRPTPATDIYSLTGVIYHCLAGQPPFGDEPNNALFAHVHNDRPTLPADHPWAAALNPVIARGMAKEPEQRFPTASELMRQVKTVIEPDARVRATPDATTSGAPAWPAVGARPKRSRTKRLVVGLIAALLVVVGLGVVALANSSTTPTRAPAQFSAHAVPLTISYTRPWRTASAAVFGSLLDAIGGPPVRLAAGGTTLAAGMLVKSSAVPGGAPPTLVSKYGRGYLSSQAEVAGHPGRAYTWSRFGGSLIAYVLPTWHGDAAIICQGQTSSLHSCTALARHATSSDVRVLPPRPDHATASAVNKALAQVSDLRHRLDGLREPSLAGRGHKASTLARAEQRAAHALAKLSVPARYRSAIAELRRAMKEEWQAFNALAKAAETGYGYASALAKVHGASQRLQSAAASIDQQYGLGLPPFATITLASAPANPPARPTSNGASSGANDTGGAGSGGTAGGTGSGGATGGQANGGATGSGPSSPNSGPTAYPAT